MTESLNYFILDPVDNDNVVELWSVQRLPYQPQGWLLNMRNELRTDVERIKEDSSSILHAVYQTNQSGFFDAENVLIYNVGPPSFRKLCSNGLCIEFGKAKPPKLPRSIQLEANHYHRYTVAAEKNLKPRFWDKGSTLASWSKVPCPPLKGELKPHRIWYEMKSNSIKVHTQTPPDYYGIEILLIAPQGENINLASVIKPLIDGVICSFHAHNGAKLAEVTSRLSAMFKGKHSNLDDLIMAKDSAILGVRKLLSPYRQGVMWNPADDSCVYIKLLCNYIKDDQWSMDGQIIELTERK